MTDCFLLVRPLISFSFEEVITRTNNVFVFEVLAQAEKKGRLEGFELTSYDEVSILVDPGQAVLRKVVPTFATPGSYFLGCAKHSLKPALVPIHSSTHPQTQTQNIWKS